MIIPLNHHRKVYGVKPGTVGRHREWITDNCFMLHTSVKRCLRRLKPATHQYDEGKFLCVVNRFFGNGSYVPLEVLDTEILIPELPKITGVRLGSGEWSVIIDRVYFDYFTSLGLSFVTNGQCNKKHGVGLMKDDQLVGVVMPILEG